jgi:hypothetical protein
VSLGIEAVKFLSDRHHHLLNDRFERDFVLQGLQLILENNIFAFGKKKKHFLQVKGTAMETKVAPTYATLTLGYLEHRLHQELVTRWGEEDANTIT